MSGENEAIDAGRAGQTETKRRSPSRNAQTAVRITTGPGVPIRSSRSTRLELSLFAVVLSSTHVRVHVHEHAHTHTHADEPAFDRVVVFVLNFHGAAHCSRNSTSAQFSSPLCSELKDLFRFLFSVWKNDLFLGCFIVLC